MEKVIDLQDLLKHEIMDLYSAEQQIIEALPLMIEKAGNNNLKMALQEHLKVTEKQKSRLEEIQKTINESGPEEGSEDGGKPGFFSRLFGGGTEKCKGMEGLISEGAKMMGEDMSPEALDAAIIGCAQKIEHYEISGYGTARAFAKQLNLKDVAGKLEETLNEEYEADDRLTELAVGRLNREAEFADGSENENGMSENGQKRSNGQSGKSNGRSASKSSASNGRSASKSSASNGKQQSKTSPSRPAPAKSAKSNGQTKAALKKSSSNGRGTPQKSAAKKGAAKSNGQSKAAAKGGLKRNSAQKSSGGPSKSSAGKSKSGNRSKSSRGR